MTDPKDFSQLIPPHGGYRKLKSYQTAEFVYDATVVFCRLYGKTLSRAQKQEIGQIKIGCI